MSEEDCNFPLIINERLDLGRIGIEDNVYKSFDKIFFNGTKVITQEIFEDQTFCRILNINESQEVNEKQPGFPVIGDSIISFDDFMAIKAGICFQIFSLSTHDKIRSLIFTERIRYWKFINENTILFICKEKVFLWNWKTADSEPKAIFLVSNDLNNFRITNCVTEKTGTFFFIISMMLLNGKLVGKMQFYSTKHNKTQTLLGYAADFLYDGGLVYVCYASKVGTNLSITVTEVNAMFAPKKKQLSKTESQCFQFSWNKKEREGDLPIALHCSQELRLINLVSLTIGAYDVAPYNCKLILQATTKCSKLGYFLVVDTKTGRQILEYYVQSHTFTKTLAYNYGVLGISRLGKVLSLELDPPKILAWLIGKLAYVDIALALLQLQPSLPITPHYLLSLFFSLFRTECYEEAAFLISYSSAMNILRHPQILNMFLCISNNTGCNAGLYFDSIMQANLPLFDFEATAYIDYLFERSNDEQQLGTIVTNLINAKKLRCSSRFVHSMTKKYKALQRIEESDTWQDPDFCEDLFVTYGLQ